MPLTRAHGWLFAALLKLGDAVMDALRWPGLELVDAVDEAATLVKVVCRGNELLEHLAVSVRVRTRVCSRNGLSEDPKKARAIIFTRP